MCLKWKGAFGAPAPRHGDACLHGGAWGVHMGLRAHMRQVVWIYQCMYGSMESRSEII